MLRTPVAEALGAVSAASEIRIGGWVRPRRDAKGFSFLELNDGSCLGNIQCIVDEGTAAWDKLEGVNTGACVAVTGELVESPGKGQKWEVRAKDMTVFGLADPETFPLQKKRHSDEFLRTIAHLRSRTNKYGAAFRIRAEAAHAVHDFFYQNGFYYVHTPILTGSDCEGAGEMFRVTTLPLNTPVKPGENPYAQDFFGKECSLTVSGQLEAEALALGLGKVYTFGPTFRAENSNTPRHAAEFWMIEPEVAFTDINDNMDLAESLTCFVINRVLERRADDMDLFDRFVDKGLVDRLKGMVAQPFARCSYREAIERISSTPPSLALICRPSTSVSSPRNISSARWRCMTIPKRSRLSICARTTTVRPWPRWTYWFPASANSSAAASARSASTCSKAVSAR